MTGEQAALLAPFFQGINTLTVATLDEDGPAAASVFFAADDDLKLYFISSKSSRHMINLMADSRVAVTIDGDFERWRDVKGLQIRGAAAVVAADDAARVEALYLARFPEVAALLKAPSDADEARVAGDYGGSVFVCITPRAVRVIDNARGFGDHREFLINGESCDF